MADLARPTVSVLQYPIFAKFDVLGKKSCFHVFNCLPFHCMKTLYYSIIHPHISYGLLAWGNAKQSVLNKFIILQRGQSEPSIEPPITATLIHYLNIHISSN